MNKKGFTLSEVLLVLSVIGVVAALTIPTLLQKTSDAQLKAGWRKTFADISQAAMSLTLDSGGALAGLFITENVMKDKFANYFSVLKNCNGGSNMGCWHNDNSWKNINGNNMSETGPSLVLNNGSLLLFHVDNTACPASGRCGWIAADVNGQSKPNVIGRDIFLAEIRDYRVTPFKESYGCEIGTGGWAGADCSLEYIYK